MALISAATWSLLKIILVINMVKWLSIIRRTVLVVLAIPTAVLLAYMAWLLVAGWLDLPALRWSEEVKQEDGSILLVKRKVWLGGRYEIGQGGAIAKEELRFNMPGQKQEAFWHEGYDKKLGRTSQLPIALHIHNGTAFLVTTAHLCVAYNKWGRPNPPYIIWRTSDGKVWRRISLYELPNVIKSVNLLISSNRISLIDNVDPATVSDVEKENENPKRFNYELVEITRKPVPLIAKERGYKSSDILCPMFRY